MENKLHFNPFTVPCKEHEHTHKFHLDCKKCVEIIKESMFTNETEWNKVLVFDEVADFMKERNLAV